METSRRLANTDTKATSLGLMETLRMLESSLRSGLIDEDKMWKDRFPTPPRVPMKADQDTIDSQNRIRSELKSSLEELEHLLNAIERLTSSLQGKIRSLKTKKWSLDKVYWSLVRFHWVNTAPDDILENIFEKACLGSHREALNLARVNKRFYNVVMQSPRLWNTIDSGNSHGELRVGLERSKDAGLNVTLDSMHFRRARIDVKFLDLALSEAFRRESFVYRMEYNLGVDLQSLFRDMSNYTTGLRFPRLKRIVLHYPSRSDLDGEEHKHIIDHSEPLMHFYTSWFVPKLTWLRVINLFPRPFLHLAPPLTTLELFIGETFVRTRVYNMDLLLEFLRSNPLLETLRLTFDALVPSTIHENCALPETVLPNVRTFRFTTLHTSSQSLLPLMKALRFPLLGQLHVRIESDVDHYSETRGNEWLDCILPLTRDHYTNVEVFSFMMDSPSVLKSRLQLSSYNFPFMKLPNLRSLTLQTPCFYPNFNYRDAELPKLKDIHFLYCHGMEDAPLRLFRKALEIQDTACDALEEVKFTECRGLFTMDVGPVFQGRLKFFDYVETYLRIVLDAWSEHQKKFNQCNWWARPHLYYH